MKISQIISCVLPLVLLTGCAGSAGRTVIAVSDPPVALTVVSAFDDLADLDGQVALRPAGRTMPLVTIAATGTINPGHAPLPENEVEKLVFHHCYRTLTRIALDGTVRPDLAQRWESFNQQRRWEITLDPGARFWDGTPVTAGAVLASWQALSYRTTAVPSPPNPLRWLQPQGGRVLARDARTLVINLNEPMADLPAQLAHPALAVRGAAFEGSRWPVGTGPCRPAARAQGLDLVPAFPGSARWDTLRILLDPSGGPVPDLILSETDGQPAGMTLVLVPWDRMYVLICPPTLFGATENERSRWTTDLNLRGWADQAAPNRSRPAETWSFITDSRPLCPYLRLEVPAWSWPDFDWPRRTAASDQDLVLYPDDDPVARQLAVILADHAGRPLRPVEPMAGRGPLTAPRRPSGGLAPQALGLASGTFEAALQAGRAGCYVLPVSASSGSGCRQVADILGRAVWLQEAIDNAASSDQPLPAGARALNPINFAAPTEAAKAALRLERARVMTPLILTRPQLWSRPDLAGLTLDFQGNLDLTAVGRR